MKFNTEGVRKFQPRVGFAALGINHDLNESQL